MLELRNICWKEFIYNAIFSFRIDSLEKEKFFSCSKIKAKIELKNDLLSIETV
ncbi:hypothetical protein HMPREF0979_01948 [Coprobacillus sp. 8_1_38FAA]|nr:hypothetical protein HMPREF0979_01948 [Coprobacillus sp. 8_1_38FAA]